MPAILKFDKISKITGRPVNRLLKPETFNYASTSCCLTLNMDGVMVVTVRGLLTHDILDKLRGVVMTHATNQTRALCLRIDRAVVAFGGGCLDRLAAGAIPSTSMAIVVSPVMQPLFQDYAWRAAKRGYVRVVFTSASEALMWSAAQARLAQTQSAWVARRLAAHCPLIAA